MRASAFSQSGPEWSAYGSGWPSRSQAGPPGDQPQPVLRVDRDRQHLSETLTGTRDWTRYQITLQIPADAEHMGFELTLVGPGTIWLRNVELARRVVGS